MKNKKKNIIFLVVLILLILPLIYAGENYSHGNYNTNNYGMGNVPAPSSGGESYSEAGTNSYIGGWGSNGTYACSNNLDCNKSQYCFKDTCHKIECFHNSDCNIRNKEICLDYRCEKPLYVVIKNVTSPVVPGEFFRFNCLIKNMANINNDIKINFWIEKNKKVIASGNSSIYIKNLNEKVETSKLFLPTDIQIGNYTFFVQVSSKMHKTIAHKTIEIIAKTRKIQPKTSSRMVSILIGFFILILLLLFYLESKKFQKRKFRRRSVKK